MYIELCEGDRERLVKLLESRLGEIGSEIRRSMVSKYHDELKDEQAALERLLRRLHDSAWDVTC